MNKNDSFFEKNLSVFEKTNIMFLYTHFMKEGKNKWELEEHSHPFCELHIVIDRECIMDIENHEVRLQKYDYVLIPSGMKHRFKSCNEKFFRFSVAFNMEVDKNKTVHSEIFHKSRLGETCIFYIKNVMREYENNEIGSSNIINSNVCALLIEILRSSKSLYCNFISDCDFQSVLRKSTLYIENNILQKITVKDVSKEVFVSVRQLNRIFVTNFGMTVTQYIKNKKIVKSKEYLEKTDFTVKEISFLFGMKNSSTFCRFFENETGISPKSYRMQNKHK